VSKGKAREESQRIDARSDGGETDERTQERSGAQAEREGTGGGKLDEAWFSKRRLFFPGHWAVQSFRKSRLLRNYAGLSSPIRRSDDALVSRAGRKRGTKPATEIRKFASVRRGEWRGSIVAGAAREDASASIQRWNARGVTPLSLPFGGPRTSAGRLAHLAPDSRLVRVRWYTLGQRRDH